MLIDIYRQSYFNRQFELKVVEAHQKGLIKSPIYLSIGTEHIPSAVASVVKNPRLNKNEVLVFPQHRCHSWLLSFGADPTLVAKEILGRSDGLNKGMGGSASLAAPELRIYGHDGLLGSNAPIGVGMAHATGKLTIIHLGDAAIEEDYVLASFGYAVTHKCKVIFIVEDNDLSILTATNKRRSWNIIDVAAGFGLYANDRFNQGEHPQGIYAGLLRLFNPYEREYSGGPALFNIKCERHLWHCGSSKDSEPKTDTLLEFRNSRWLSCFNLEEIESTADTEINAIWEPLLAS